MTKCITKGVILAGGTGTRMYPATASLCKQLLPVYDKPMIYYPLSTLFLAGIKDILIVTTPSSHTIMQYLIGDGSKWGVTISYAIQQEPLGVPDAFRVGGSFIDGHPVALILGDNFFYGHSFPDILHSLVHSKSGCRLLTYKVQNPKHYGVVQFDSAFAIKDVVEKPKNYVSDIAVTGLYFFDSKVCEYTKSLMPSARGELEITDLIRLYIKNNDISHYHLGRGYAWLDLGDPDLLQKAANYVSMMQERQATFISSPEEVAWYKGFISDEELLHLAEAMPKNNYSQYLRTLIKSKHDLKQMKDKINVRYSN